MALGSFYYHESTLTPLGYEMLARAMNRREEQGMEIDIRENQNVTRIKFADFFNSGTTYISKHRDKDKIQFESDSVTFENVDNFVIALKKAKELWGE